MKNYYDVLGVSRNSETEVITAAYKAMMRKYHPDTNKSAQAAHRAKEINEAYEVLKNPLSRREYDAKMGRTQSTAAHSPTPTPTPPPPPPPPSPPRASSEPSEPAGGEKKTFFSGEQGELQIWVIFVAAYVAILLFYYGPNWISAALEVGDLGFWAEAAGAALVPFALAYLVMRLWKALASTASDQKSDRIRWLFIQFAFVAVLSVSKMQTERAEGAVDTSAQERSSEQAVTSEVTEKCYAAFEAKNWRDAWTFCSPAAESGDATSQSMIGYLHDQGLGGPKNPVEAVNWFRKAAEQGEVTAQNNLAIAYDNGTGVAQNSDQAIVWYEKAAAQGNEDAKSRLAEIRAENSQKAKIDSWIGRYKGTLFGDAEATMHVTQKGNKLNFDLFMEGERCGGGFEQATTPKNADSIVVTMPYDADSGLQCKVQINQKSFGLEIKELSACHMHHGFQCGFEGNLFRE